LDGSLVAQKSFRIQGVLANIRIKKETLIDGKRKNLLIQLKEHNRENFYHKSISEVLKVKAVEELAKKVYKR